MKKIISSFFVLMALIVISCDGDGAFGTSNPPEVKLVLLNEDELLEKSIGDEIEVELGLEVSNMPDIMSLDFEVKFDPSIFTPVSFDYEIPLSFFYTSVDAFYDNNQNGVFDDDEEYIDLNGNGAYDPPVPYPTGLVMIQDSSFVGQLGIANPELNGGNVWGTGRVCNFSLTGTLQETFFSVEVKGAQHYIGNEETEDIENLDNWDVIEYLPVGSPYDPYLLLEATTVTDLGVQIALNIDDSPKLAKFKTLLTYDSSVLSFVTTDDYNFFNENYSGGSLGVTNVSHYLNEAEGKGEISIEFLHDIENNPSIAINDDTFSSGSGSVMKINFIVFDSTSPTIINLNVDGGKTEIKGYNANAGESYAFDLNFWEIMESLTVSF